MRERKGSVVIPAHSRARRRVIISSLFRREIIEGRSGEQILGTNSGTKKRATDSDSHTIQEIPAGNLAVHAQVSALFHFDAHAQSLALIQKSFIITRCG